MTGSQIGLRRTAEMDTNIDRYTSLALYGTTPCSVDLTVSMHGAHKAHKLHKGGTFRAKGRAGRTMCTPAWPWMRVSHRRPGPGGEGVPP